MRSLKFIAAPFAVALLMLVGTITFQMLLYFRYGQSLFDNMDLPGADFAVFANSPAIIRWPSQLIARAWHLWVVQGSDAIVVLAVGTMIMWAWLIVARPRMSPAEPSPILPV